MRLVRDEQTIREDVRNLVNQVASQLTVPLSSVSFAGVLDGAMIFTTDFVREWVRQTETNPWVGFVRCRSYSHDGSEYSSPMTWFHTGIDADYFPKEGTLVLLDTLIDTGGTLNAVAGNAREWGVLNLNIVAAALARKTKAKQLPFPTFWSWTIEDDPWLVGYGLDHDRGRYRAIPYIGEV